MMNSTPQVSIVIPLFNEELIIPQIKDRLNQIISRSLFTIEVILINDGSTDKTEQLITEIGLNDNHYQIISLSRNFGHQMAITAGLSFCTGSEAVFVIDGDLQDPPELIDVFYQKYKEGYDVVYGIRKKRKENLLKRSAYSIFYRVLKSIASINLPLDSGDFSLMSRKVVDIINTMPEESRFIRGMRAWVGYKQIGIEYNREERSAGKTKYSFNALIQLAYNGIFNFSEFPVKLISKLGFLIVFLSFVYIFYAVYRRIFLNDVPEGFTALIIAISLFSGVQLLALGIIGEYVTRIFIQSKKRPLYVVKWHILQKKKING